MSRQLKAGGMWLVASLCLTSVVGLVVLRNSCRRRVEPPKDQAAAPATAPAATAPDPVPALLAQLSEGTTAQRIAAAKALGELRDPAAVGPMLRLLDQPASRRGPQQPALPPDQQQAIIDALASIGDPAVQAICRDVVDGEASAALESAAREVLRRAGPPAAGPLAKAILAWQVFPDPAELAQWVKLLGEIGDASAAPALDRALGQDIAGMDALVAQARKAIEARLGQGLPPSRPDGPMCGQPDAALMRPLQRDTLAIAPVGRGGSKIPTSGVLRLTLKDAIVRPKDPGGARSELEIELIRRDGQWAPTLRAYARAHNKRDHDGRLLEIREGPPLSIKIDMLVLDDYYVRGGVAEFQIDARPQGEGFVGQFKGHSNFVEISGPVTGVAYEQRFGVSSMPLAPGERPRLLLRQGDVPALRQRARTDVGRAILGAIRRRLAAEKLLYHQAVNNVTNWAPGMDLAIGHGFFYSVFGDLSHGRRGAAYFLPRCEVMPYQGEHGERWPGPLTLMPFGHDLVLPSLTDAQRHRANASLGNSFPWITTRFGLVGALAGGVPQGTFGPPGTMAVSLLHEPMEFEVEPPTAPPPILVVAPPADAAQASDVPVNDLEPGKMLRKWLLAGPFALSEETGPDPLAAIGGPARRLRPGDSVDFGGRKHPVTILPETAYEERPAYDRTIGFLRIETAGEGAACFLFGRVRANAPTGCLLTDAFNIGPRWTAIWINGKPIARPTVVLMEKGVHDVLIRIDRPICGPSFLPADWREARTDQEQYLRLRARWESLQASAKRDGHAARVAAFHDLSRRGMRNWLWHQAELARRTGQCGRGDIQWPYIAACHVAGEPFFPDTPFPLAELPPANWRSAVDHRHLIFAMGMAPAELQRALAEEFRQRFLPNRFDGLSCLDLAAAFVNYPMDAPSSTTRPN